MSELERLQKIMTQHAH